MKALKGLGYRCITVTDTPIRNTGGTTELRTYGPLLGLPVSDFATYLLRETPLMAIKFLFTYRAEEVEYAFREVLEIPKIEAPTYTFIYLRVPHRPFLFDRDGNPTDKVGEEAYLDQLIFVNKRVTAMIDSLLLSNPIIILQSDTGPGNYCDLPQEKYKQEKLKILCAYHFPDGDYSCLYQSITSVNTFRVVFNKYFETDLELLEDRSYYGFPDKTELID